VTEHDFANKTKFENISIASFIDLNEGDYAEVYAKCSVSDTIIVNSLSVLLQGA